MTAPLSRLQQLEEALAAATPGPWSHDGTMISDHEVEIVDCWESPADAAAIVALRNLAPGLIAAVRAGLALADEGVSDVREWGEPGSPYSNGADKAFRRLRAVLDPAAHHTEEGR